MDVRHPLDPLTAPEFRQVVRLLRRDCGVSDAYRFAAVELAEPAKSLVKAWQPGDPCPRRARAVVFDRRDNRTYEALLDLAGNAVAAYRHVPDVTANITLDEWSECDSALKSDPQVVAALAQRGLHDLSLVLIDVWSYAKALMPARYSGRRLGWCDVWARSSPSGNPYAHAVGGLKLLVDLSSMRLLEVENRYDPGMPDVAGEYDMSAAAPSTRPELKDLRIVQPHGVSFSLTGNRLTWQNWSMRLGFNHREGLVVHQVAYEDQGRVREIAHRMSIAEMVVPYRDPGFDHYRRTAYDVGEWGLGFMTASLEQGCDCLGEITYLDAVLHDSTGEPYDIANAICVHEEDNGVLWKHVDERSGSEVRRMRRLVVSSHASVANYEYLFYWRFYQDGSIEFEVRATGLMVTSPLPTGAEAPPFGTVVDERTYAPFHQHFLIARLDLDVDGEANTVTETDSVALPVDDANPYGLAMVTRSTAVESEAASGRDYDWAAQRTWSVTNESRRNRHGAPVAYKLVTGACLPVLMDPAAVQLLRAPVLAHSLWVTREHPDERWPCGDFPTQSQADLGMSRWVADDEPLAGADVVLWHVFGIHHITRAEDWPVMPVDTVSFWLKPSGFFDRNPALDVAPAMSHGACAPTTSP